jgi:quinolinate synthase
MADTLVREIVALKKKRKAIILAHNYQMPEIQDIGDVVGDSLALCKKAASSDAEVIVFCGVWFMAESAALLNPDKTVILPEKSAGCPMADMADAEALEALKLRHPGAVVVCYVNSNADVKAVSDICCTSSNAEKVVASVPEHKNIIFVPDRHLGGYVREKTGRPMILWSGYCPVHQQILPKHIIEKKKEFPGAKVLVHPECSKQVVDLADFVGSTAQIVTYASESAARQFIIGTENGILHGLGKQNPDKCFIPASDHAICTDMKKISLEKIYLSLKEMQPVITVRGDMAEDALKPVKRMMAIT